MRSNVWAMPALLGLEPAQNIDLSKFEGVSAPRTGPAGNAFLEDPKTVYNRPATLALVADMARNSRLFGKRSSATVKRQGPGNGDCFDYPAGAAQEPDQDTGTAFESYQAYSDIANQAAIPDGFTQSFQNLNVSVGMNTYMGLTAFRGY